MTKFEQPSFSSPGNSKAYRDNYDEVFGAKNKKAPTDMVEAKGKEEEMTQAQLFINVMMDDIKENVAFDKAEIKIENGIVKISFNDGSYLDFTEPMAFKVP